MSSTRIGPRGTLTPEVGRWSPVPLHWISKKTIRVVVFHRRRSSHLFYTPYVFSQCQTRVKLNLTLVRLRGLKSLYLDRGHEAPAAIHQAFGPQRGTGLLGPVGSRSPVWITSRPWPLGAPSPEGGACEPHRAWCDRVFFPRWFCQARSLGCGFAR